MTPAQFRQWRTRLGLSQAAAAEALGISRRQLIYYEMGEKPIPRLVELATQARAFEMVPVMNKRPR